MLLHLPQSVEIIGLNGESTLVTGLQRLGPLSETVKTLREATLRSGQDWREKERSWLDGRQSGRSRKTTVKPLEREMD